MTNLATDLRAATVGNRELDARIALAAGWTKGGPTYRPDWFSPDGYVPTGLPDYSTDLTSIVALIEARGWIWNCAGPGHESYGATVSHLGDDRNDTNLLPTAALALAAALAEAENW